MIFTWVTSLFANPKAEDVAGTGDGASTVSPVRPDAETDEGPVVRGGRRPDADGSKQAAGRGGGSVADVDAPPAQDVKIDIAAAEQEAEPSTNCAGASSQGGRGAAGQPRQDGPAGIGHDALWRFQHLLLRRLSNSGAVFQAQLSRIFTFSWLSEGEAQARSRGSAGYDQQRKRLRDFAKKAIPIDSVLLVTFSVHRTSYRHYRANTCFAMSMAACLLAFFADSLSAVLLINSTDFAVEWHYFLACVSSVSMMLVPYLLLVSFNKLSAYALLAVPLPVAAALLHRECSGTTAAPVIGATLDHIFDISSAVNNIAAGGGLTGTIFGYDVSSKKSDIPAGPLGFLLFITIIIALYLMLVTTVRPPVLSRHAEPLSHVLVLLLALSALVAAVNFLGWLACIAFSIDVIEAAVYAAFALAHGASGEVIDASRKKEQQLLSAAVAAVMFTVLMQLHSRHAPEAAMDGLPLSEILRMLLYFAAFLWSLNRMVFLHVGPAAGRGAGVWASWVWSAVDLSRTLVLMLAILDVVCNLGISALIVL